MFGYLRSKFTGRRPVVVAEPPKTESLEAIPSQVAEEDHHDAPPAMSQRATREAEFNRKVKDRANQVIELLLNDKKYLLHGHTVLLLNLDNIDVSPPSLQIKIHRILEDDHETTERHRIYNGTIHVRQINGMTYLLYTDEKFSYDT